MSLDDSVQPAGLNTEHYLAGIVLFALAILFLIRRGFRGVSAGGISVGVK